MSLEQMLPQQILSELKPLEQMSLEQISVEQM